MDNSISPLPIEISTDNPSNICIVRTPLNLFFDLKDIFFHKRRLKIAIACTGPIFDPNNRLFIKGSSFPDNQEIWMRIMKCLQCFLNSKIIDFRGFFAPACPETSFMTSIEWIFIPRIEIAHLLTKEELFDQM